MRSVSENIVQVAGISDLTEARTLVECGVDFLGFPLRLDVHDQEISEQDAGDIIRSLVPPHFGVVITYLDTARDIVSLCKALGASIVQLHGDVPSTEIARIKEIHPRLKVNKSIIIHPEAAPDVDRVIDAVSGCVDGFITDTFDPVTGASGATGRTHDWVVSRRIVERSPHPVILAGGLTPENVADAIRLVGPAGVDVHTGVEDDQGRKDRRRVEAFVTRARDAFARL